MVYFSELDELFRESNPYLSVLELEPETFWQKIYRGETAEGASYVPNIEAMARISELPQHKLVHSVGFPIGGSFCDCGNHVALLAEAVNKLGASWASEHLSFNAIQNGGAIEQVGFLLPPRQTCAGARTATSNIRRLAGQLPVPFAFETGVNYLQPRAEELPDGEFFASIAEAADCGIVLDLHNLWVNERNGREPVANVIDALPLDRVWEVHLAGGMMLDGYYLDSHSAAIPEPLIEIAAQVIPRLPNLGALIFEILPAYMPQVGLDAVRAQLSRLNALWQLRPAHRVSVPRRPNVVAQLPQGSDDVIEWERVLGTLAVGHTQLNCDDYGLKRDGGVAVLRTLIDEARDARISRALRFTTILLLLHLGPSSVHNLLADYRINSFPDMFTSGEADRFASYLHGRLEMLSPIPFLASVLAFEHALVRATLYGTSSRIEWDVDPTELFAALDAGQIPSPSRTTRFIMDVVAEG